MITQERIDELLNTEDNKRLIHRTLMKHDGEEWVESWLFGKIVDNINEKLDYEEKTDFIFKTGIHHHSEHSEFMKNIYPKLDKEDQEAYLKNIEWSKMVEDKIKSLIIKKD